MESKKEVCWYCHKPTMVDTPELGYGWLKCSNCGATEQQNPTIPNRGRYLKDTYEANGQRYYYARLVQHKQLTKRDQPKRVMGVIGGHPKG